MIALVALLAAAAVAWPNAQVPLPDGPIRVSEEHCPYWVFRERDAGPCFVIKTKRIYLGEAQGHWRRYLLAHEIGHLYDDRHLNDRERRQFRAVYDAPGHRWNHPVYEQDSAEDFAELYGACLRGARDLDDVCALIRSFK